MRSAARHNHTIINGQQRGAALESHLHCASARSVSSLGQASDMLISATCLAAFLKYSLMQLCNLLTGNITSELHKFAEVNAGLWKCGSQ